MAKKVQREPPMIDEVFPISFVSYFFLLPLLLINSSSPPSPFPPPHLHSLYICLFLLCDSVFIENMTNQNVIVSDRNPILVLKTITVSVSNSPLLSNSFPTYFTFPRRMFLKLLEAADKNNNNNIVVAPKIASFVDSMRDSSPTRLRSSSHDSVSDNDNKTSWIVRQSVP